MIIDSHIHFLRSKDEEEYKNVMKENKIRFALLIEDIENSLKSKVDIILEKNKNLLFCPNILLNLKKKDFEKELNILKTLLKNPKIVGIKIYPGYEKFDVMCNRCKIIYKIAENFCIPIIIHTGEVWEKIKWTDMFYSRPIRFDRVASTYKNLTLIFAHMGSPAWIKETAMIMEVRENVYCDIAETIDVENGLYSNIYNKMIKREFMELISIVGSTDRILFATDWGIVKKNVYKIYKKFINSLDISKTEKNAIFFKNAIRVFNLK